MLNLHLRVHNYDNVTYENNFAKKNVLWLSKDKDYSWSKVNSNYNISWAVNLYE